VHGELGGGALELASFQSVCALLGDGRKAGIAAVRAGETDCARRSPSEFSSRWFRPSFYEGTALVDAKGRLADGGRLSCAGPVGRAGAVVVEPKPASDGRVAIDGSISPRLAGRFDACMWGRSRAASSRRASDAGAMPAARAHAAGAIALLQDFAAAEDPSSAPGSASISRRSTRPHRSRPASIASWPLLGALAAAGDRRSSDRHHAMIPRTNGSPPCRTGNVGSASIWVMLDAMLKSRLG
jgi:3-oxoacyl-[acyl-carrier-protein] synthase-3